jgi:hypothetical protein
MLLFAEFILGFNRLYLLILLVIDISSQSLGDAYSGRVAYMYSYS